MGHSWGVGRWKMVIKQASETINMKTQTAMTLKYLRDRNMASDIA